MGLGWSVMRKILKGFLMLRQLAFIPLLIVVVLLLEISALTGDSDLLGIAILAAVPVIGVAALGGSRRGAPASHVASHGG
jgi:hypothetical protein